MKRIGLVVWTLTVVALTAGLAVAAPKKPAPNKSAANKKNAAATAAASDSDVVLVRVGSEVITPRMLGARLTELPDQYRPQYSTPEGRKQLLDRMIEEKVWIKDAEANGVLKRPELLAQIEAQRRDLLIRTWVNEVMAKNPAPTDSEATVYYHSHLDEWKTPANVTLRHIQLKTEADAKRVLALVRAKGADWDKLAKQFSADTLTRGTGGSLGTATRDGGFAGIGSQPALAESAMALGADKIGGPYKTDKGWHIIKVESYRAESVRDFDQVRSFIVRQLQQERTQRYYQDQLTRIRAQFKVAPDSAAVKKWMSAKKSARDMFQEAQGLPGVPERLALYRQIVDEYPQDEVTPQALFMVGFIQSEESKDFDAAERVFRELLQKYPSSELASSAKWMVDHMRTDEVPDFLHGENKPSGEKKKVESKDGH